MSKIRIVVTGMGAITPVGNTVADFWHGLKTGASGVGPITHVPSEGLATTYAAEVKNFDPDQYMEKKEARKMDRFSQMAVGATQEALAMSGLDFSKLDPFRIASIHGVGIGGMASYEGGLRVMLEKGFKNIPVMTIPKIIADSGPANAALIHGSICGPAYAVTTACSSGTDAIGAAVRHLFLDEADVVIAGGVEAAITQFGIASFNVLHALSTKRGHEPQKASRPFDADRDGFVMGEGAGIMILERLEHAQKRGAKIYGEFVAYSGTCDAYHYTAPHPEGFGAVRAMKNALSLAGIAPSDVQYINAHGTATPVNDPIETKAIKEVFGSDIASMPNVSSTKSMTGHCLGATGMFEAIACVLSAQDNFIPPTINLDTVDPECELNHVANVGMEKEITYAMSNTFGFGGHNSVVIFKKYAQ